LCCVLEQDNFALIKHLHQFVQIVTGDLNAGGSIPSRSLRASVIGLRPDRARGPYADLKATVCAGD